MDRRGVTPLKVFFSEAFFLFMFFMWLAPVLSKFGETMQSGASTAVEAWVYANIPVIVFFMNFAAFIAGLYITTGDNA